MHAIRTPIARLSAACALALAVGAAAAAPAIGAEACPTHATAPVVEWTSLDPLDEKNAVSLCRGVDASGERVMEVQIVDFEAGAKMRIMSQPQAPVGTNTTMFTPRLARRWHEWMGTNVSVPPAERLFSVTNGARAHHEWAGQQMSFPQKKWNAIVGLGSDAACHRLPDSGTSAKRYFGLSDPNASGRQFPYIDTYDDGCQSDLARATRAFSTYWGQPVKLFDATVGFHPLYGDPASRQRRTFVGTRSTDGLWRGTQDRAYILTSVQPLTIAQARGALTADFHTMHNLQLDGGGATQYAAPAFYRNGIRSLETPERLVPEVVAVYDAP